MNGRAEWSARGIIPRILLVEDDPRSHQLLRRILMHEGCDVTSAMTQAGGLEGIGGGLDCVILDLRLPDGDGETILKKIRTEHLALHVAVTTAEGDPDRLRRVAELQPDIVLKKPINLPDLLHWLDRSASTCGRNALDPDVGPDATGDGPAPMPHPDFAGIVA